MKRIYAFFSIFILCMSCLAQTITLKFTGRDANGLNCQLNHIIVTNLSQNWQETLYWPDTTLTLNGVGIDDFDAPSGFKLSQNIPNPFMGTTDVSLDVLEMGDVCIELIDIRGKKVLSKNIVKAQIGTYIFRVKLSSPQIYVLTAHQGNNTSSIMIVNMGTGDENTIVLLNHIDGKTGRQSKNVKSNVNHSWAYGDNLVILGVSSICGTDHSKSVTIQLMYDETVTINFQGYVTVPIVDSTQVSDITGNSVTLSSFVNGACGVTSRGFCYSTISNPTLNGLHTSNGSDTGNFTSNILGLMAGTTYYVRAYATNSAGTAYGDEVSFTTHPNDGQPCPEAATVSDYDNNTYNTVKIGSQCWMKENLKTTHYANGISIPMGSTYSYTAPYRYAPNDDSVNVSTYGYLYNWAAVMHGASSSSTNPSGVQGICPIGWHVPSDAEWTQLTNYVGSQIQYVCGGNANYIAKALAAATGWNSSTNTCAVGNDQSANDATGFSVLPAGYYGVVSDNSVDYALFCDYADFWSSTEGNDHIAYDRGLIFKNGIVGRYTGNKYDGFSVRCLRD